MATLDCASTVELCAVRATRLDSLGNPSSDANNVYVVQDVIQLQYTENIREGEDREMNGGCGGCIIASKSDEDQFRRYDLELQAGRIEPGLLEMMTGTSVITDGGTVIGAHLGIKLPCGTPKPRVAFEAWSKRWTVDDEQDPEFPWWHWLWVSTAWVQGQNTLQADFSPIVLTGKSRANSAWGSGPYGDQPEAAEGHLALWADAGDLPTATCDYSTVEVAT